MLTRSFELRNVHSVKTKREKHELGLQQKMALMGSRGSWQNCLVQRSNPLDFNLVQAKRKLQFKTTYFVSQLKASATSQMKLWRNSAMPDDLTCTSCFEPVIMWWESQHFSRWPPKKIMKKKARKITPTFAWPCHPSPSCGNPQEWWKNAKQNCRMNEACKAQNY